MTDRDQAGHAPRYRVVVYELRGGHQAKIMDVAASAFIAAAASIQDGEMDITLGDGGACDLTQHIALLIARQHRA